MTPKAFEQTIRSLLAPIVILGGLDSLPGTIIAALAVGILESVVAGYIDPIVGGGFTGLSAARTLA